MYDSLDLFKTTILRLVVGFSMTDSEAITFGSPKSWICGYIIAFKLHLYSGKQPSVFSAWKAGLMKSSSGHM